MNRNFGKLEDGNITYAPDGIIYEGRYHTNPPVAAFLAAGWHKVTDTAPTAPEGFYARPTGWAEEDGEIVRQYEMVAIEPTPKTYNKYRLGLAIEAHGLLDALLAYFAANPSAKFHWDNAQDFTETDDNFKRIVSVFRETYGSETVTKILTYAEV